MDIYLKITIILIIKYFRSEIFLKNLRTNRGYKDNGQCRLRKNTELIS